MTGAVLGTMTFGDTVAEPEATRILRAAIDEGIEEIDTAVSYSGGRSEEIIGRALGRDADHVSVSSKVGMQRPLAGGPLSAHEILRSAQLSVDRVGRPLDTLYVHQPDRSTPVAETAEGLATVLERGLARRIGISNHSAWTSLELASICRTAGMPAPARAQQVFNPLARNLDLEYFGYAREHGIEVVVYNPLAGGLLSGKHVLGHEPEDGRFATSALAGMYRERYWKPEYAPALDGLSAVAADAGISLPALCLRWAASHEIVSAVLIGASRAEHLTDNLRSLADGPLPCELVDAIDDITAPLRGLAPAYAR
jgi:aryl-alcohol dehydrogenase-like predicted oxidoreductase